LSPNDLRLGLVASELVTGLELSCLAHKGRICVPEVMRRTGRDCLIIYVYTVYIATATNIKQHIMTIFTETKYTDSLLLVAQLKNKHTLINSTTVNTSCYD